MAVVTQNSFAGAVLIERSSHKRILCSAGFVLGAWAFLGSFLASANPGHDRLSAMSEADRQSALASFLVGSGVPCARATKTFYQGSDDHGNAFWNVACDKTESWVIQVNNDSVGSTKILSCRVLEAAHSGRCFQHF